MIMDHHGPQSWDFRSLKPDLKPAKHILYCIGCFLSDMVREEEIAEKVWKDRKIQSICTHHISYLLYQKGGKIFSPKCQNNISPASTTLAISKTSAIIHGLGQAKSTTAAGASVDLVVARLLPLFQLLEAPWMAGSNSGLHSVKLEETFGAFLPLHLTTLVGPSLSSLQQTNANQLMPGFPKLTFAAPLPKHRAFPNNPFYSFRKVPSNTINLQLSSPSPPLIPQHEATSKIIPCHHQPGLTWLHALGCQLLKLLQGIRAESSRWRW